MQRQRPVAARREAKRARREARFGGILERSYGVFSRALTLPSDADPEKLSASYKDSVLHVAVGKRPEATARAVAIIG